MVERIFVIDEKYLKRVQSINLNRQRKLETKSPVRKKKILRDIERSTTCSICNRTFKIGDRVISYGVNRKNHYPECYNIVFIDVAD